ncbi:MAG: biotin/lipoyl-binding protein, partial [Candidatus Aminicenantes bacterium]
MDFSFWLDNKEYRLNLEERVENEILVSLGKKQYRVSVEFISGDEILLNIDGKIHNVIVNSNTLFYSVYVNGRFFKIEKKSVSQILGKRGAKTQKRDIKTSMPGRIVKVFIKEGDKVKKDQAVLVLEAMKMQNEIKSPQSGVITRIGPAAGDSV